MSSQIFLVEYSANCSDDDTKPAAEDGSNTDKVTLAAYATPVMKKVTSQCKNNVTEICKDH
jgi:hypothetical protein